MPGLSTFETDNLEMSLLSTVDRSCVIRPRAASRTTASPDGDAAFAGLVAGEF